MELTDVAGRVPTATLDGRGRPRKGTNSALGAELAVTYTRQDRFTDTWARPTTQGDTPMVFDPRAAEALWVLHNTLLTWARDLGYPPGDPAPGDLAAWLLHHLDLVQKSPDAGVLADEVTDAVHQARRAIDRPSDDRLYLGPCDPDSRHGTCREELYAWPWVDVTTCPRCYTNHRVTERREWLRERALHYPGTAAEVAGFLRLTGIACTTDQVRGYARSRHGRPPRITPAGRNERGHLTYLVSDVVGALRDRYVHRPPPE